MQKALYEQASRGHFDAIVIDTNIFDKYELQLETGLLRRIEQFSVGNVRVLMPDVIRREVERHLVSKAIEACTQLQRALRLSDGAGLLGGVRTESSAIAMQVTEDLAKESSRTRLESWLKRTSAQEIDCGSHVDVATLMAQYFEVGPPFAATGAKKSEFPDAVALLALKAWAESNKSNILAVSNDEDWVLFAEGCDRIEVVKELAVALAAFQNQTAQYACMRAAELLMEGDPVGIQRAVFEAVNLQLFNKLDVTPVFGPGDRLFRWESIVMNPTKVGLVEGPAETRFSAVEFSGDLLIMRVPVCVQLAVSARWRAFELQTDGSSEGEVESKASVQKVDVVLDTMVSVAGKIPERMRAKAVEILPASITVEFGRAAHT